MFRLKRYLEIAINAAELVLVFILIRAALHLLDVFAHNPTVP